MVQTDMTTNERNARRKLFKKTEDNGKERERNKLKKREKERQKHSAFGCGNFQKN